MSAISWLIPRETEIILFKAWFGASTFLLLRSMPIAEKRRFHSSRLLSAAILHYDPKCVTHNSQNRFVAFILVTAKHKGTTYMEEPSFTGKLKIVSIGFGESSFSETRGETIGSVKKKKEHYFSKS